MIDAYFADKKHNNGERSDFGPAIEAAMNSQVDLNSRAFRTFLTSGGNLTECGNYLKNKIFKENNQIKVRRGKLKGK